MNSAGVVNAVNNTPTPAPIRGFPSPQLQQRNLLISGATLDASGAIVGSCVVDLFSTPTNVMIATTVSDPTTGAYSLPLSDRTTQFYIVAYKAGPPTTYFGTTANTLVAL